MEAAERCAFAQNPRRPVHLCRMGASYFTEETEAQGKYTAKWQTNKPYVSIGELRRLPWCTVVSGHDDLSTGGVTHDPD